MCILLLNQQRYGVFLCRLCALWLLVMVVSWSCADPTTPQEQPTSEAATEATTEPSAEPATEPSTEPATEAVAEVSAPVDASTPEPGGDAGVPGDLDLAMSAEDFGCILKWDKVNRYRITNKLGFLPQALAVANAKDGGVFPVGTVIQLVPQEAMVKRKKGWNPTTNDWEFFFLKVEKDKTTIVTRGKEEVKNQFGGSCFGCHSKAEAKWDLICSDTHGCDPLPLSPALIENLQNADPRCP